MTETESVIWKTQWKWKINQMFEEYIKLSFIERIWLYIVEHVSDDFKIISYLIILSSILFIVYFKWVYDRKFICVCGKKYLIRNIKSINNKWKCVHCFNDFPHQETITIAKKVLNNKYLTKKNLVAIIIFPIALMLLQFFFSIDNSLRFLLIIVIFYYWREYYH